MALLFIGVTALICLVNFIAKDKESSEKENRMLTQKPAVTWAGIESGRFMSQYESYKSDQFAGRDLWVSLKTSVDLLSGKRESNGVFKGKDHGPSQAGIPRSLSIWRFRPTRPTSCQTSFRPWQ